MIKWLKSTPGAIFLAVIGLVILAIVLTGCTVHGVMDWNASINRKNTSVHVNRFSLTLGWERLLETEQDRENQRLRAERRQTRRRMNVSKDVDHKQIVPTVEE